VEEQQKLKEILQEAIRQSDTSENTTPKQLIDQLIQRLQTYWCPTECFEDIIKEV